MAPHTHKLTLKHDHSPAVLQVVRYGLPLVILIFYITASWNFSYTPDSTFLSLRMAHSLVEDVTLEPLQVHPGAAPNPLWTSFLAVVTLLRLDSLLGAKIFGLFFSSLLVLLSYLLASEILRDHLLAFCSALAVATSGLLLQAAPAGSGVSLALTFALAGLFFMLRNDYVVSSLMLGLGTLVTWQVGGAFVLLLVDVWFNSTTPQHRWRTILFSVLVYVCAIAPWVVFVALRSAPLVPWLVGLDDFPPLSLITGAAGGLPALVAVVAAIGMIRHRQFDNLARQSHLIVILWASWFVACSAFWGWDFYLFALPVVAIYALSSVQQLALMPRSPAAYAQAFVLTGVFILLHQLAFNHTVKPAIIQTEQDSEELVELAYWIKNGVPEQASVSARRPERLSYFAGRPVGVWEPDRRPSTDYVITAEEDVWGYDLVARASRLEEDELVPGAGRFAVWRKK